MMESKAKNHASANEKTSHNAEKGDGKYEESKKTCFIICPIGSEDSEIRRWSDDIYRNFILPIAEEFGYEARRAIDDAVPGEITASIIRDVVESDLVIADLTFSNANVFYELAIRHSQGKPFIHIAKNGTNIPFDIYGITNIFIENSTFGGMEAAKSDLRAQLQHVINGKSSFENPVKRYHEKSKIEEQSDPTAIKILNLEEEVRRLSNIVSNTEHAKQSSFSMKAHGKVTRFSNVNSEISADMNKKIEEFLLNKRLLFIFNPKNNQSKYITFENNGSIGEGRNNNEHTWNINNGCLEIFNSSGDLYSRFNYSDKDKTLYHTNDLGTKSIIGQIIKEDG